jgi:hypothetical protein
MSEKYKPTSEEIAKAESMMTDEQKELSERRLEEMFNHPEQHVDELIELLEQEYEDPSLEPDFASVENAQGTKKSLAQALQDTYEKMPLEFNYFLQDLRSLKKGIIKELPRRTILEYMPIQVKIGQKAALDDERNSGEILDHLANLVPYVARDIESDSDMFYHESQSQSFRHMVGEIIQRIKNDSLAMKDEEIASAVEHLQETVGE